MKKLFRKIFKKKEKPILQPPLENYPNCPEMFGAYRHWINCPDLKRVDGGFMYKGEFYPDYLNVGGACHVIFRTAKEFCKGIGIDIGAGFWAYPGSTPIDTGRGNGLNTTIDDIEENSQDYVFSSHCLEHIENWENALKQWVSKVKQDGIIFLYLPHPDCKIWNPGSPFVGDFHKWIPTPEIIKSTLKRLNCEVISFDDGPDAMQSFYVCGKKK